MESPRVNPYLAVAIGVIAVSTSAILVKVSSAPSGVIAFYRLFFSVLLMLPVFLLKYVSELRLITKQDWVFTGISGVFLAFHFILWFESLNYTSVASSTVLVTLQPLFAFAGAYFFFKEKVSAKAILSGLIAIAGSVIISWGDFKKQRKCTIRRFPCYRGMRTCNDLPAVRPNREEKDVPDHLHLHCLQF